MSEPTISHLERRAIEAGVLIPMLQAFQRAIGEERANEIARAAIATLARRDGERWAGQFAPDLSGMEELFGFFAEGGSLEIEVVTRSTEELGFNVTRCAYADFYREAGSPEFGLLFSCGRDFAMVEGFSRGIELQRTHTIMEGATHCDFRYRRRETD